MRLISNELKSLVDNNQLGTSVNVNVQGGTVPQGYAGQVNNVTGGTRNLLSAYIKRRAYALILISCVLILLVTTSVFTDLGLNIGQALFDFFSKLLGFS